MGTHFCRCRDCRRMRRKGRILGTRTLAHFAHDPEAETNDNKFRRVSAYVRYQRWQKGRRPD